MTKSAPLEIVLTGPRADNPLGFLATLGALATLNDAGHEAALGWQGIQPILRLLGDGTLRSDEQTIDRSLAEYLHRLLGRSPGSGAQRADAARKAMDAQKTARKAKLAEIKARRLPRVEAAAARKDEVDPLSARLALLEAEYRMALLSGAADPSVALGKNLTVDNAVFAEFTSSVLDGPAHEDSRLLSLIASFGIANPQDPARRMDSTPWALVTGSGHQDFLLTVERLMFKCTPDHLQRALFGPWVAVDDGLSLRLDVDDDRRYALMDRDPQASGNAPRSLWGATRLAFEGLRFFTCSPATGGLRALGWQVGGAQSRSLQRVRWPVWQGFVSVDVVRSLLSIPELWRNDESSSKALRGLGVTTVFESRRIAVGSGSNVKINLTPPTAVWVA